MIGVGVGDGGAAVAAERAVNGCSRIRAGISVSLEMVLPVGDLELL